MEQYLENINQDMMMFLRKQNSEPITENEICEYCNNTGWEYDRDTNTAKECRCGIRQRQIMESKLKFADIPLTYKDVRLVDVKASKYLKEDSKVEITKAKQIAEFYLEHLDEFMEQGKGLYLFSRTKGSGKTMTATAIANELIHVHKKNVKFATSTQIINEIRSTWDKQNDVTESSLLHDLSNVDFLIVDDFGTENVKDWIGERFYQIINSRYIDKKVTIYTSNYSIRELPYEDRITNRITERSFTVHFPEESIREMIARVENARLNKQIEDKG